MTRREFIVGAAAAGAAAKGWGAAAQPKLRVGIMSDTHCRNFDKGFRIFDAAKVDAVLITGDMFLFSTVKELEDVAREWFKVFPNDRRSDGGKVERLFVTGNHDEIDWCSPFRSWDDLKARSMRFNREAAWKRLFGEDYEKIRLREVKGYKFVLRHWLCRGRTDFGHEIPAEEDVTPAFMSAHAAELHAEKKPFFYVQHEPITDTVNCSWLLGGDKWDVGCINRGERKIFDRFPNCIALTGHSHETLTDEKSIWQGAFTAVNCGCAHGHLFTPPGRENGRNAEHDLSRQPPMEMDLVDRWQSPHGLVMDVFDDEVRFRRLDILKNETVGPDWVVPLFADGATVPPTGVPKYDFKARKAASKPPRFAADAKVTVSRIRNGHYRQFGSIEKGLEMSETHEQVKVSFPSITTAQSPTRAYDFSVRCEVATGDIVRTACESRVFSPRFAMGERWDADGAECLFAASAIPKGRGLRVRFVVTPYDCWGNAGEPIASAWM